MTLARKAALATGIVACALVLGGCVAIKSITVSQSSPGAPVHFTIVLCANDVEAPVDHPGCEIQTNAGETSDDADEIQLLLAVQVPAGTTGPQTIDGTEPEPGKPITFTRSPSYESELTKLEPPPSGRQWLGWLSNVYNHTTGPDTTPARETTLEIDLRLPAGPGGGPFPGTFDYRWVVGGRASGEDPFVPERPVECGEFLYTGGEIFGSHICIDHPDQTLVQGAPDVFSHKDFGVTAGAAAANPGATANVPFELSTSGPIGAGPTATLAAGTTLPGVTPAPDPASVPLTSALTRAGSVPVAIPAGAEPGAYEVTVTATAGGVTRRATGQLTVNDTVDPVARALAVKPKRFKPSAPSLIAAAGARVSYRLTEPATVRFKVRRCRGKRCKRALKGGFAHTGRQGFNAIRFSGFLRNKALKRGKYQIVATPTDAARNRGKAVRAKFSIRR